MGGERATGGDRPGPAQGGNGAGGEAGKPPKPPGGPHGMGGAGGTGGTGGTGGANGGETIVCPLQPPENASACTDTGKCAYTELECRCDGPEGDRTWKCKQPAKPMTMCPPSAPEDGAGCKTKEGVVAAACPYGEPAVNCTCTVDKWVCVAAP